MSFKCVNMSSLTMTDLACCNLAKWVVQLDFARDVAMDYSSKSGLTAGERTKVVAFAKAYENKSLLNMAQGVSIALLNTPDQICMRSASFVNIMQEEIKSDGDTRKQTYSRFVWPELSAYEG